MPPLVSILIPAYNAERWIGDTIRSAIAQDWPRTEVIIVDDGSRDSTLAVAKRFESIAVKVVSQENRGASAARNKALSFAQGDYIQWLDADDLLSPEKISRQMRRSESKYDDLALYTSTWGRFYIHPENAQFCKDALWCDLQPVEWLITKFEAGAWMNPASWLVSRKLGELAGPWNESLSFDDDGEYVCRLVANSVGVHFVAEARCFYRTGNAGSLSSLQSDRALDSFSLSTRLCIRHLRQLEDSDRTRDACLRLLQGSLHYFYASRPDIVKAAEVLANDLGGILTPPAVSRGFRAISSVTGWKLAMKIKRGVFKIELFCRKGWEGLLHSMFKLGFGATTRRK